MKQLMHPNDSCKLALRIATVSLLFSSATFAQSTYGSIAGVITDPSAAVIRDADVEAKNTGTSVVRTVKTDAAPQVLIFPERIATFGTPLRFEGESPASRPAFKMD